MKRKKIFIFKPSRILVLLALYVLVFVAVGGVVRAARLTLRDIVRDRARSLAVYVAALIQPDHLNLIHEPRDMKRPEFQQILNTLRGVTYAYEDIRFIYILRPDPDPSSNNWSFIVDAQPFDVDLNKDGRISSEEEGVQPGHKYDITRTPVIREALKGPFAAKDFYTDQWGTFVSGFAPIQSPRTGEAIAVLGVDVPREIVAAKLRIINLTAAASLIALVLFATLAYGAFCWKTMALEMVRDLDRHVTRQNEKLSETNLLLEKTVEELEERQSTMGEDLVTAQKIQEHFLPLTFPFRNRLSFASYYKACSHVGGDLYGAFGLREGIAGFHIADVSGHGVSAALISAILKVTIDRCRDVVLVRRRRESDGSKIDEFPNVEMALQAFLDELNRAMRGVMRPEGFITFLMGLYQLDTGDLYLANAGHNPPFILRGSGEIELLSLPSNMPLGVMPAVEYKISSTRFLAGDKLFLYTDGVTERINAIEEEFGLDRLMKTVRENGRLELSALLYEINQELDQFGENSPPRDDQSILIIEHLKASK